MRDEHPHSVMSASNLDRTHYVLRSDRPSLALSPSAWVLGALLAIGLGVASVLSLPLALGLVSVAALGYLSLRSGVLPEVFAGAFWFAFSLYQTVLTEEGWIITGFFYPFYGALIIYILYALAVTRLRLDTNILMLYVSFLVVVLLSFIGMSRPVDFFVIQRLFAYVFGFLILFQVSSKRGLATIAMAAVASGTVVSGWVILMAIQGGFEYRGDIHIDQNLTAFIVGIGAMVAIATAVDRVVRRRPFSGTMILLALLGVMLYGSLLLASRGMFIAMGLGVLMVMARSVVQAPRILWLVILLLALTGSALLMPGGSNLIERFQSDTTESGNNRVPVWEVTLSAFMEVHPVRMLFGNGFKSSEPIVHDRFGFTSVHNAFLQILYEFGIVGLALFLGLHVHLIWRSRGLEPASAAVVIGLTWFLLGANLTADSPDGFMYWTALGFVMASCIWGVSEDRARPRGGPV